MATILPSGLAARLFIDHLVLVVSDIARTREFYSKIFGDPTYHDPDKIIIEFFIYA
jgi:extradiol dioxygenase family protein